MVNVSMKVRPQSDPTQTQSQRSKARIARIRSMQQRKGVRVEPRDEDIRRVLKHPSGVRFRSEGSVEWPDDKFTWRRLRDGDVKLVEERPDTSRQESSRRHQAADPSE